MTDINKLERQAGYEFSDKSLLERAITHRSAGRMNNERLEFLGDSVLGLIISNDLFARYETASEGQLSRTRSSLVKEPTLAEIARRLDLGDFLNLGVGELKSGGFNRDSILSDALEALIGAIYLDGGLQAATEFVHQKFAREIAEADPGKVIKDPKTRLQEFLQQKSQALPRYEVLSVTGASHQQLFRVACELPDSQLRFESTGSSKRKAEQAAAEAALDGLAHSIAS